MPESHIRSLAPAPTGDLDMSGVDPLRREEVRRRVSIVKGYLALPEPDDADRTLYADALGLSASQFMALVRAWIEYPSASTVAGSGSARGRRRTTGPRHLKGEARRAAEGAIAGLDAGATLAAAITAVTKACTEAGQAVPSKTTVWKMLMEARRERRSPGDEGVVIVGRCWIRMPVRSADVADLIVMPSIALAVRARDGVILGFTMREETAHHEALVALAATMPGLTRLLVDAGMVAGSSAYATDPRVPETPASVRRHLARALGDGIGDLRLVYKTGAQSRPERLLRARKDAPLSSADAGVVVRAAVDSSNAARGGQRAVCID